MNAWINRCMGDEWIDGWMDGWMYGCMVKYLPGG